MENIFHKKILKTIAKYQMVRSGDKVLVGFSGGPDSMALLHSLNELKKTLGIKIYTLHVNHQLRAKAADEDEKVALEICQKWNILAKSSKVDVKKYAQKHKLSTEESARVLRYQELSKEAKRLRCNKIALGHNANDNTETVILNLTRGSGLAGLSGIPPKRNPAPIYQSLATRDQGLVTVGRCTVIRPLIETNRKEILAYLRKHKIKYCADLTNIELGYRRNYIRHKIIPLLYQMNPNLDQTILRTSEIIRNTNDDIIKMTELAKKNVLLLERDRMVLDPAPIHKHDTVKLKSKFNLCNLKNRCGVDIKKFLSYNLLIRREIIKTMLPGLEFEQIESILALTNKPSGKRLELAKDFYAWREYNKLYFAHLDSQRKPMLGQWNVNIGKTTKIPELGLELTARMKHTGFAIASARREVKNLTNGNYAVFDKSAISLPLSIRLRKPGDRFIPFKGKEKKLKDILIDDKIPVRTRGQLPLLCDEHNILWIIGSRRSNIGLITKETKEIIEVKIKNAKETSS